MNISGGLLNKKNYLNQELIKIPSLIKKQTMSLKISPSDF